MGGGLPTGGQGSKVCVLCAEPKEHNRFRPGTRPGGIGFPARRIGDRGDREIVYVPNVYVPFPAPSRKNAIFPGAHFRPQNRRANNFTGTTIFLIDISGFWVGFGPLLKWGVLEDSGGGCTRVKWVPFVLLAFFPLL